MHLKLCQLLPRACVLFLTFSLYPSAYGQESETEAADEAQADDEGVDATSESDTTGDGEETDTKKRSRKKIKDNKRSKAKPRRERQELASAGVKPKKKRHRFLAMTAQLLYEKYKIASTEGGPSVAVTAPGFEGGASFSAVIVPRLVDAGAYVGLGLTRGSGKGDTPNGSVTFAFNPIYLAIGATVEIRKHALAVKGAVSYDYGFTGSAEARGQSGTTGYDIASYTRWRGVLRPTYYFSEKFGAFFGLSLYSGDIQLKNLNTGSTQSAASFRGSGFEAGAELKL